MKHTTHHVLMIRMSVPILSALVVALFTTGLWAAGEEWEAPSFRARKNNPVPADVRSIAAGKTLYVQECLKCHGTAGKGDGPATAYLEKPPADLSTPVIADQSDGSLFWKISTGLSPMPAFESLITEEQRWDVVNYIRTLAPTVPVTAPLYDAPASYRQRVSSVVNAYLTLTETLTESLADDEPDPQTDQALAAAVQTLATSDPAELPEAAQQPWQELTQALLQNVQNLGKSQDADTIRLQFKSVSDSLTRLVQAFGHAGDAPLVLFHCDKSFDHAGASWLRSDDRPRNPYANSESDRDCGQAVARLAAEIEQGD